jgi:hypothetical protein
MTDRPTAPARRGRRMAAPEEEPVGTAEYATVQTRYRALAGQLRILAYTVAPDLLLARESWLWPQLHELASDRGQERGPLADAASPPEGTTRRHGTRREYLELAQRLRALAFHSTGANFAEAEEAAWEHVWGLARRRGRRVPYAPGDDVRSRTTGDSEGVL